MAESMQMFLELIVHAAGFKTELNNTKTAVGRFAAGAKRELAALRDMGRTVQGQLAAIGISIGAVKTVMDSARLDKSLIQIGQTAGEGTARVGELRKEFFRLGRESGGDVDQLKTGFNNLIQAGLSMKASKETLDGINTAMAVTGATADTLAGGLTVAAEAFDFDLEKPGKALELLDQMTVAGRLGNAELENLSDIFARVGVNAKSAGMGFDKTLAFIEGLSQVERQPERLATLADSTLRVFTNLRYMASAQKATGVKFFDEKGSRRDAVAVLEDIKKKYDTLTTERGKASFIQKAFGAADLDTIKGIKTLLEGDSLAKVKNFSSTIANAGGTLKRDFDEATNNLVDQAGRMKNVLRQAADGFAQPINRTLTGLAKWALDSKKNGGLELSGEQIIGGGSAAIIGAMLAGRYGGKMIGSLANKFLSGSTNVAAGIAAGKAVEAAAGITPVFVTNWQDGGLGAKVTGVAGGAATGGALTMFARSVLPAMAAFGAGYVGGNYLNKGLGSLSEKLTNGKYGGEGWLGNMIYDLIHREQQNNIELNVAIDERGRVTSSSSDSNTRAKVNPLKRGDFEQWQTEKAH